MFSRNSLEKYQRKWYTTDLKLLNRHFLFCVLLTLTFILRTSKCIQLFYMSLSIDRLNLKPIGQKRQRNRATQLGQIFKDCLLVTLTFVLWPCICRGILYLLMSIQQPSFIKIGWKMTEKSRLPVFPFCVLVTLTFDLRTPKNIQFFYKSLSIIWPHLRKIGW